MVLSTHGEFAVQHVKTLGKVITEESESYEDDAAVKRSIEQYISLLGEAYKYVKDAES